MDQAATIDRACGESCRDFTLLTSPQKKDTLVLRWTAIDISDLDRPKQCYHYACFNPDGSPQNCGVNYDTATGANAFFMSLTPLYTQLFANDHKQKHHVHP